MRIGADTRTPIGESAFHHRFQWKTRCLAGLILLTILGAPQPAFPAFSLVITNGYGDVYRMNLLRNRDNYQAYRGVCSYRGFSLSGCSTTGEVVMLRIKETPTMPEHLSILSTSMRWGTTMYVLNDLFHPLCSWVMSGYENWYPFDMSCSVAMYINSGGFGFAGMTAEAEKVGPLLSKSGDAIPSEQRDFEKLLAEPVPRSLTTAWSLVMTNGYGDVYRMNLLRDRENYQAYRGVCSYRGFSLSGCSTTGEVVMLRIKATPSMPEHFSLVSTSMRWGTTMYFLNDVFRPLNSWVMAGYENWYPFDMSCSVAMYINSGGFGLTGVRAASLTPMARNLNKAPGGTNIIGALIPLTGDLADLGASYQAAYEIACSEVTNTPGMPPVRLLVKDTITDPLMAVEQLAQMYTQGVQVVLGPESSAECDGLREYAETHGMLLLSSSSTAVPLAVPGDNLMRMAVDDSQQAKALAEDVMHDGITNLLILTRSDMYGEGLRTFLLQEFATRGGHVFFTGYCPRAAFMIPEVVTQLNVIVSERAETVGAENIGVILGVFDEGVDILQYAAAFTNLAAARWYGAEGMAGSASLLANSTAREFARQTQFSCSEPDDYTNALYSTVSSAIQAKIGVEPRPYALHAYDAFWLAALGLRDTDCTGTVAQMRAAIRTEGAHYAGASGPIYFNAADDRSNGCFQIVRVTSSNTWANVADVEPEPPVIQSPTNLAISSFRARWHSSAGAIQYYLDVSSSAGFEPGTYAGIYSNLLLDAAGSQIVTGLSSGETYYYRVRAGNSAGTSSNSAIRAANLPAYSVITASASPGGRVVPSGPVIVYPGWSAVFTATASNYYEIAEIRTNDGIVSGAAGLASYTQRWDEVTADGQVLATFRARTATNGVPLLWLAQYYTVTTNGDELALSDGDADGLFAWEEYVAGTVPTNFASCLRFLQREEDAVAEGYVLRWSSSLDRLYTLLYTSNPVIGWTIDPGCVDIPGTGSDLFYTSSLPQQMPCGLYRLDVRMSP